jgi:hypothetical protein
VGLGEGVQLRPYKTVAPLLCTVVEGRGDGLAQLRLAHPGGAVKDEGEGAQRLPLAGVGPQLEGGGHHRPLLAQHPALEVLVQRLKGGGHGGGAAQRLETVRHGLEAGEALQAALGKKAAQAWVIAGICHGGAEIEQVVRPIPPEAQPRLPRAAARRHAAGREFIAPPQAGAGIHPLLQQGGLMGEVGTKLGKVHGTASAAQRFLPL